MNAYVRSADGKAAEASPVRSMVPVQGWLQGALYTKTSGRAFRPLNRPPCLVRQKKNSSQEHWMDCIFCRIAEKRLPAKIVYEDDSVVAFEDINPQAPVHVLVIPRKHIPTSLDLKEEDSVLVGRLFQAANRIARQKGIADRGFRIVTNCNKDAGQTVFHIHIHLMGGRPMGWPPG